jgi:hypothetical protein
MKTAHNDEKERCGTANCILCIITTTVHKRGDISLQC